MDIMKKLIFASSILIVGFSCNKSKSCYDADLAKANETTMCTQDCPGFEGCDGKTYCNPCIAAGEGIGPK